VASSLNDDNDLAHANHDTISQQQHYPLFYNNNDNNNISSSNKTHRVGYDAATRWTKTKRRYGKNNKVGGVSSLNINNNNIMSHTMQQQIVDDVLFVMNDSLAILSPAATAGVNNNDRIMIIDSGDEEEEGGEYLVFNKDNNGQEEGRATSLDEFSATSSSSLHGNRDRVKDCDGISHIQRFNQEIDSPLVVDSPLNVEYQECLLDHPPPVECYSEFDEVTHSNNIHVTTFSENVQHTNNELVITTPSTKQQRGDEQQQQQLIDSISNNEHNKGENEDDDERYELDEYDTPSIFNPTIYSNLTQEGDECSISPLHITTTLTRREENINTDIDCATEFDNKFAIDKTIGSSRIHLSKERKRTTYGDGKPVWASNKLSLSTENHPMIVGWDDTKGRPIYCTTARESNSLSKNKNDVCLPSTRSLDESEINSNIPKQRKQKKRVYTTLFKRTGLSQSVRDEMDIDQPPSSSLLDDPPPPRTTAVVAELNMQTITDGLHLPQRRSTSECSIDSDMDESSNINQGPCVQPHSKSSLASAREFFRYLDSNHCLTVHK
jgi:hypothetical protein